MKCFIHTAKEAVAACKTCGKGMCANCSAYSGHTGICPECREEGFLRELVTLKAKDKSLGGAIVGWSVFTVVLGITVIGLIFGVYKIIASVVQRKTGRKRIEYLEKEIRKLEKAKVGNGVI